jgi:hypothetical protein
MAYIQVSWGTLITGTAASWERTSKFSGITTTATALNAKAASLRHWLDNNFGDQISDSGHVLVSSRAMASRCRSLQKAYKDLLRSVYKGKSDTLHSMCPAIEDILTLVQDVSPPFAPTALEVRPRPRLNWALEVAERCIVNCAPVQLQLELSALLSFDSCGL